ncbi:MAG: ABC transporter ATP-binding protein [Candidatus Humimicrobiaceae bacterium]
MASVSLINIYKYYWSKNKKIEAVKNLNLDIKDNEIIALLGPSGCGKSTTLRMIAGLEEISSGELYIGGKLSNNLTSSQRNIALAFEDYALYFHLTVWENIALCLRAKKINNKEIVEKIKSISKLLGIENILQKKPAALSGGEQQRVSLARALVRDPSVFLLDEPISHIEIERRFQILAKIKEIHYEFGTTMVYVTHNQSEAVAVGERIGIMNFAELQQIGTRYEIFNSPVNTFVAGFVGQPPINLLKCKVLNENGEIVLKDEKSVLTFLPEEIIAKKISVLDLDNVIVGIRPQNLALKRETEKQKSIKGIIEISEFLGEDMHLVIKNGDRTISIYCNVDSELKKDKEIELFYDQNKLHIFHSETEKAIRA